jgi:hypothetical protein
MNLRTTPLLFGLLLGILWLFGLMIVYKKGAVDQAFILPTAQGIDVKIDAVTIEKRIKGKDKDTTEQLTFNRIDDQWYVVQGDLKVKVENFHVDDMIREITNAKRYEEERTQPDTRAYGLPPGGEPRLAVTLKGKVKERPKEWTFNVGNPGNVSEFTVYVNSSDRPGRAFPALRSTLDKLFFKDVASLRATRLFETAEAMVTFVEVKEGDKELALKKVENTWRFERPPLGFAGFESTTTPEDAMKKEKNPPPSGVKMLIGAISAIHVNENDFEPIGAKKLDEYDLAEGKEQMRIVLGSGEDKPAKAKDEKAEKTEKKEKDQRKREVLLIGQRVRQPAGKKTEEQVYARMKGDDGVFRISARYLDPIKEDVRDPKRIRSKDIVAYDAKKVDAVVVTTHQTQKDDKGKETTSKSEFKLLHPPEKDWQVVTGDKIRKGNDKAILALIEHLQGQGQIMEFADGKNDSWVGPTTSELTVYIDALEKEKKKDEKKTDKKASKKDKEEKKEEKETAAEFKKDVPPFVRIIIGNVDKTKKVAHVKRVLPGKKKDEEDVVSRFSVPLAFVEKLNLDQGALAYIDTALPSTAMQDIVAVDVQRGKDRIEIDRVTAGGMDRWTLTDVHDPYGGKLADAEKVRSLVRTLTSLTARKWVKNDPEKLGLKDSSLVLTLHTHHANRVGAVEGASLVGMLGGRGGFTVVPGFGLTVLHRLPKMESAAAEALGVKPIVLRFGKEIEENGEKLVYAEDSQVKDLAFLVPAALVKSIRDADFRDRSGVKLTQFQVGATMIGLAAGPPLILASPLNTGVIHAFDPTKVKEVSIALRSRVELRTFRFSRVDKTWVDQSGTTEFTPDADKVTQMLDKLCKLRADRFASFGGPTGDSKLTPDDATLVIELKFEDKTKATLTIGVQFENLGYFAHSSAWRDAVFFVPPGMIDPWLQGSTYFGKERAAGL